MDASNWQPRPEGAVVVGVDESPGSEVALGWAVAEAQRSHAPLHLVQASGVGPVPPTAELMKRLYRSTFDIRDRVAEMAPDLSITTETRLGAPAPVLVEASRRAACLVMGARGYGRIAAVLLGSVPHQVLAHATCPVVIAREPALPGGPVVVGLDGSESSANALAWAFEHAQATGVPLRAVHTWWWEPTSAFSRGSTWEGHSDKAYEGQCIEVTDLLSRYADKFPDVPVQRHLLRGQPAPTLVEEAAGGSLLVVGTRGRGGFAGLLLGSVSQTTAQHAPGPVAVIPPPPPTGRSARHP